MEKLTQIKEMAHQAVAQNNCRLYDVYQHRDRLQVFIDRPGEGTKRVSVEDCESVFHSFSFLIRSKCPEILKTRRLEVSSPGLNKKLRERWHFLESLGREIRVVLFRSARGTHLKTGKLLYSRSLLGKLEALNGDVLEIESAEFKWQAPLSEVKTAQAVWSLEKPKGTARSKKSKSKKRG